MPRRISPESSFETLKQEAKDWLKALRANVADARARFERALHNPPHLPTLRDVQHALARELGFTGWAALKERRAVHAGDRGAEALATYERMAANLLDAYRTGTQEAMERHWADTWHRRSWQAMRTYVQLDLGKRPAREDDDVDITLDDARFLVAREAGFENWKELRDHSAKVPSGRTLLDKAVRLVHRSTDGSWETVETTRDWDAAVATLKEGRANALHAEGHMTDAMLESIAGIDSIAWLHLGGSAAVSDAGIGHLATLTGLRGLDVSSCRISDAGMSVFRDLPLIEQLSLSWTPITDVGVAHLAGCAELERVSLAGTRTGDGALRALGGKEHLRKFDSGVLVTDAGMPYLHDFPVFKEWRGGEVKLALLSPDAEPNQLGLRGTFTDRGLACLVGLDGLFALNIDDASLPITSAGLAPLAQLPHLGMLAFDARDDSMPYIAAMPVLRFLMAQDTVAGDDGFVALSRSKSIELIWGRRCHNLRRRGFQALANMPALCGLSVSCKNVDDEGVAALPHFPALRELMPMDIPDKGYRHIGNCTELDRLILMYCRDTGDVATSHITGLPKLSKYFASYTKITDRTPELLSTITSIEEVELQACPGVTNAGIATLARLPRLRELRISGMQHATRDALAGFPARIHTQFSL
jgi:hypothetical protein